MVDQVLDAQGLNCPLPILKAKKSLKDMAAGEVLQILATDPGAVADFQAFCRTTGNELMEFEARRQGLYLPDQAYGLSSLTGNFHAIKCTFHPPVFGRP